MNWRNQDSIIIDNYSSIHLVVIITGGVLNVLLHDAKMCNELGRTNRKNIKKRNLGAKDWKNRLRGQYSWKWHIRGEKDK